MAPLLFLFLFSLPVPAQKGMGSSTKAVPRPAPLAPAGASIPPIELRDVAARWGVTAQNYYGGTATKRHILEMSGNGVALIDFDNDGKLDILLTNGARLDGTSRPSVLYRNLGNRFESVDSAAPQTSGWVQGACAGDYDNDGFTDVLITRYGGNLLFRNDGGRFREVSFPATPGSFHTGCTFTDYDRDGRLDIFVASYVSFPMASALASKSTCSWLGVNVFCGPRGFATGVNHLFHNESGRFADVSSRAGIRVDGVHYGFGTLTADFDDDGWPDIYVACDSTPSLLYRNNHDGTFSDVAVPAGTAYGENGEEQGGMGAAAGDYDRDGRVDLVRTNFIDETATTLYRNLGGMFFTDQTVAAGLAVNTRLVAWGTEFIDLDQDGRLDLVAANGHIYPELVRAKTTDSYAMPRLVYWNAGNVFLDATRNAGPGAIEARVSRGLATGDLNGDGSPEIVIVNMNDSPTILTNNAPKGNWLLVRLTGTASNRSAIGARVTVKAGGTRQTSTVPGGSSYLSQPDFRRHFGLGELKQADRVEVDWPSGKSDSLVNVPVNREIEIREGSTGR